MKAKDYNISSEKFQFHTIGETIHDKKLETKPMSYFKDALYRFTKNKASILAAFVIALLLLFAIIGPFFTPYKVIDSDINYGYVLPKSNLATKMGIKFWDGKKTLNVNKMTLDQYLAIEEEINKGLPEGQTYEVVCGEIKEYQKLDQTNKLKTMYEIYVDTYNKVGMDFILLNKEEYKALQEYQDKNNIQILYPVTEKSKRPTATQDKDDPQYWYATKVGKGNKTEIVYDENGKLIPIYKEYAKDENGNYIVNDDYTSKMRIKGDNGQYAYADNKQGGSYHVRVNYREYYIYYHTQVLKDKIKEPIFLFGATSLGKDLFVCLASGARFSFILSIIVATVNLVFGAIYGAIEGYYGGKVDLIMERVCDILGSIPFYIVITLLKYHLNVSHLIVLFISFFLTGWMGMAGRTRMQFYRFKNQEYVLVARTLGAKDRRIMFKHIFPNAIGTLITSCVLVIPSVIFSETSLTYLQIIDLESTSLTSVGTLLAHGQNELFQNPHVLIFPSLFISLLMLSFNLFGNGLRDAFNPSLRGTEE